MCVGSMAVVTYLRYTVLMSLALSGFVMFGVSKRLRGSSTYYQLCSLLSSHFLADQISCRSYVDSVIVCSPLQFLVSLIDYLL